LFDFRGRVRRRPQDGSQDSPVRITLPDGTEVTSGQPDLEQILSGAFGRDVAFEEARPGQMPSGATAEEYWPDIAGLDYRDSVTDFQMPAGTFFDIAVVHLLTTATINRLRVLYPGGRFEVRRFRPNIVVSTQGDDAGFVENDWIGPSASSRTCRASNPAPGSDQRQRPSSRPDRILAHWVPTSTGHLP
jgi:uncharacterized protein